MEAAVVVDDEQLFEVANQPATKGAVIRCIHDMDERYCAWCNDGD